MQKYWQYIKLGDLAIEHRFTKLKTANIDVPQTNVMAIHATNAKLKKSPIFINRIAKFSARQYFFVHSSFPHTLLTLPMIAAPPPTASNRYRYKV